ADAGRDKAPPPSDEILALSDGRFGFRVADPITSERRGAFEYEAVREARKEEERAERLRLYYVAMTRAQERLVVSGAIDPTRAAPLVHRARALRVVLVPLLRRAHRRHARDG